MSTVEPETELNGNSPPATRPTTNRIDPCQYNHRSPAVKRLLREAAELSEATDDVYATPLEDNLFEWHFTIRGAPDSDFAHGLYHGRITLPTDYPMKPPSIMLLTPNGRFETGTKICLSISSFHPETWQPCWSIRTALVALISFMTTDSPGAIGSLEMSSEERKVLARRSLNWECPTCGPSVNHIQLCGGSVSRNEEELIVDRRAQAQSVFRLPHPSTPHPPDGVIPPETLTRDHAPPPLFLPSDPRAGDSGHRLVPQQFNNLNLRGGDDESEEESDDDEEGDEGRRGEFPWYSVSVGSVLFAIASLILRRLVSLSANYIEEAED